MVPDAPGVEVKPMFGNLGAFVHGNMFMGLFGTDIGVKLPEDGRSRLLAVPGAAPFGPRSRRGGRPTRAPVGVDVVTEIVIDRPLETVSAYAIDPTTAPSWYARINSVELETDPPLRVGSRMAFVARFLGRRLAYTYEIVDLVPGQRLVMRTAEGPFPMETTYTWTAAGDAATRMTLRNRGEPAGFSRLVAPFRAGAVRRANRKDLTKLKTILEAI
jgi:uncharacterized protein YndB with AHSA1/START domain